MSISIVCECGRKLKAPDSAVGKRAKCPACGTQVTIERPVELLKESRVFWKDPIVVIGASVPVIIVIGFLSYLLYARSVRVFHEHVHATKAEADQLQGQGKRREAYQKYQSIVDYVGGRDAGTSRDDVEAARVLAEQLKPAPEIPVALAPIGSPIRNPKIPVEVSYPIVEDYEEGLERNVRVRLNMKVTEEVLREIALEVKSKERHQYERTFIFYEVPNQIPRYAPPPWASTHFNPTLEVEIMGLSVDREAKLRGLQISPAGTLIGKWIVDVYFPGIEIIHDNGGMKLSLYDIDGEPWVRELIEIPAENGRSFIRKEDSQPAGRDVYNIDKEGILRVSDLDRLLYAGVPLK